MALPGLLIIGVLVLVFVGAIVALLVSAGRAPARTAGGPTRAPAPPPSLCPEVADTLPDEFRLALDVLNRAGLPPHRSADQILAYRQGRPGGEIMHAAVRRIGGVFDQALAEAWQDQLGRDAQEITAIRRQQGVRPAFDALLVEAQRRGLDPRDVGIRFGQRFLALHDHWEPRIIEGVREEFSLQ